MTCPHFRHRPFVPAKASLAWYDLWQPGQAKRIMAGIPVAQGGESEATLHSVPLRKDRQGPVHISFLSDLVIGLPSSVTNLLVPGARSESAPGGRLPARRRGIIGGSAAVAEVDQVMLGSDHRGKLWSASAAPR
jgi:hypothetical protein